MEDNNYSVLRVVWEFAPIIGGSVTHITELSQQIEPYLRKQIIFAPYSERCEDFDSSFSIPIVRFKAPRICHIGSPLIGNLFYSLFAKKKLLQLIKEHNINIVHFHSAVLASYFIPHIRAYDKNLKIVVMCHGWPGAKERQFGLTYRLGKNLIPLFPPDRYLILNDGSQIDELQSVLDSKKISWDIVYHAINTDLFKPEINLQNSKSFKILFPHRPILIKKPELAIRIFMKFLDKTNDRNVSLTFLNSEGSSKLIELIERENISKNVHLLGNQSGNGMVECINASSVVIGTSLNSNNGRAIQESMACEKTVVVFDNDGNMSSLIEHMEDGILVESGDIDDFVDQLVLLHSNPDLRIKIGTNARNTILKSRSWKKRIEKELWVYSK